MNANELTYILIVMFLTLFWGCVIIFFPPKDEDDL